MAYENYNEQSSERNNETFFTKRLKAGKKRTYFFDVKSTKGNDYFITLTESKKRFNDGGYDRHKIFLYKEDFNKFLRSLKETIDHIKTELMPDFDFDAFNHDNDEQENEHTLPKPYPTEYNSTVNIIHEPTNDSTQHIEVDKW